MNTDTRMLVDDVVARLERAIRARDCPAVVALSGERTLVLSDYDYLRDGPAAAAFERRVAGRARALAARRWVLAVPEVWAIDGNTILSRPVSNDPLRPANRRPSSGSPTPPATASTTAGSPTPAARTPSPSSATPRSSPPASDPPKAAPGSPCSASPSMRTTRPPPAG